MGPRHLTFSITLALAVTNSSRVGAQAPQPGGEARRGIARATAGAPERFPHRIWAACDFEAPQPDYAWFGRAQGKDLPTYPGNAAALASEAMKDGSRVNGMNPVPGPRMGKVNFLCCRYKLRGAGEAVFQHFSLTREDNSHVRVTGLQQNKWSRLTVNFTRDAARNDGSPEAFAEGERMDDFKAFVNVPAKGAAGRRPAELLLDDVIFFSEDPGRPSEPEPFPRRVIHLAAFDTGTAEENPPDQRETRGRYKYWPGDLEIVSEGLPPDSYWNVARAVPRRDGRGKVVRLMIDPKKRVGERTKLRFRYHVSGADRMTVQLFDATDQDNRHVVLGKLKQDEWTPVYVDFTRNGRRNDGTESPFAAGHEVDDLFFLVDAPAGGADKAELLIDEVVLFDAGVVLFDPGDGRDE